MFGKKSRLHLLNFGLVGLVPFLCPQAFRVMLKEILINLVLIPSLDSITEPEYVNQTISWLCEDSALNNEAFLTVVKDIKDEDELEAVKAKVSGFYDESHERSVHAKPKIE